MDLEEEAKGIRCQDGFLNFSLNLTQKMKSGFVQRPRKKARIKTNDPAQKFSADQTLSSSHMSQSKGKEQTYKVLIKDAIERLPQNRGSKLEILNALQQVQPDIF